MGKNIGKNKCGCNIDVDTECIEDIINSCHDTCKDNDDLVDAIEDLEDNLCDIKAALNAIKKALICLVKTLAAKGNLCEEEKELILAIEKQIKIIDKLLAASFREIDNIEDSL